MAKDTSLDVNKTCFHLKRLFERATAGMERAARTNAGPNRLYRLQVEFCYLTDEIQRGPTFAAKRAINQANELINNLTSK